MADEGAAVTSNTLIMESKPLHPLHQIAMTPTHKLLLKQWLKEEELILNRIALKETQIDSVRKEITQLYCFFFLFHSIALILLFSSASTSSSSSCNRSWIPSLCSLLCSLGIIWAVRYKTEVESHLEKLLEREKEDGKLLGKCVQELKKKGLEFDLLKEVDALRRAKSLRVETKAVRKWSARDFVSLFFFTVSCLVLALTRQNESEAGQTITKKRKTRSNAKTTPAKRIYSKSRNKGHKTKPTQTTTVSQVGSSQGMEANSQRSQVLDGTQRGRQCISGGMQGTCGKNVDFL